MDVCPLWKGIPCRNKTKDIEHLAQDIFGDGYFKDEDDPVNGNKSPYHKGGSYAWNSIPNGYHDSPCGATPPSYLFDFLHRDPPIFSHIF